MAVISYRGPILVPAGALFASTRATQAKSPITLGVFHNQPSVGVGYLAGEYPTGTATVEGAPTIAEIRVLWRDPNATLMDGCVVARTQSAIDGTWRVDGLNPALRYDVVGRKDGFNDVIVAGVQPAIHSP